VIVVLGVGNPLTLGALSTALVIGVLYRPSFAVILGSTLALGYLAAAAGSADTADDFIVVYGIPVTLGCLVAVGQAIRTIEQQYAESQYRLAMALRAAAAGEERGRLARDVHDGIAKSLQGLALGAAALPMWLQRDGEQAAAQARQLSAGAQEAVQEARELLGHLRADRPGEPIVEVIREVVDRWAAAERAQVDFSVEGDPPVLATQTRYELLAALREALTNVARHASGAAVSVRLLCDAEEVSVVVQDDGPGFAADGIPQREQEGHFGLRGMTERMQSVGGNAAVESVPGRGTRVVLTAAGMSRSGATAAGTKSWWLG
jgi:signal transduction histidine kinase